LKKIQEVLAPNKHRCIECVKVPLVEKVCKRKKKLPIAPYALGVLLVGGSLSTDTLVVNSTNKELIDNLSSKLGNSITVKQIARRLYALRSKKNLLLSKLQKLKCYEKRIWEKSIPSEYLELDHTQTLELIRGMLDAGSTVRVNSISFTTTSEKLAKQLQRLLWRVGAICKISKRSSLYNYRGKKRNGRVFYRLAIRYHNKRQLVTLNRKLALLDIVDNHSKHLGLAIKTIRQSEEGLATCIKIDDPSGLFITDNYVVTHNTFMAGLYLALKGLLYPNSRLGVFGPAFRQSKFIFTEFKKFYVHSPLLQQCISKEPTIGNDQALCEFKPPAHGMDYSFIKALPVGADGGKIRGERFTEFILDECAQLPENIFRSSIKPMLATSTSPMLRVKRIQELRNKYGVDANVASLIEGENGYKVITSGYYQFNYWWEEIIKMWIRIQAGSKAHALRFVPYTDMPDGFLNLSVINDARTNDPSHVFLTEWMAEWIPDSEGVFPMSLLEACRDSSVKVIAARGPSDKNTYIFGIDVARDRDSTAIVVLQLGYPSKLVWAEELENMPFPDQARRVFDLVHRFNPKMIYMDPAGGGTSLQDMLAEPQSVGVSAGMRVIEALASPHYPGKRILKMCSFNPQFIEDANNNTKTLLEQKALLLPAGNNPIIAKRQQKGGKKDVDLVQTLINQVASVVITSTGSTGRLRYDLPKNASSSGYNRKSGLNVRKKDLYTAFILAGCCAYDLAYKPIEEKKMVAEGVIQAYTPTIMQGKGTIFDNRSGSMVQGGRLVVPKHGIIIPSHGKKRK